MKKVLSAMKQTEAETVLDEQPPEELPLLPCHVCSRTFLPKPLEKHIRICEQTARRKRKPFDSLKQRVEGTDMAPFYQKSYLKRSNPEMSSQAMAGDVYGNNKQSKWREKHFELQKTIKHAKGTKLDMNTNPPTNISITPNKKVGHSTIRQVSTNERCPVCDRSFGPKAFDRHVEFCREQKNRVPVHKSPAVVQQAKERLEARINYRVPPLKQTKRSLVREKYCPSSQTNLLHRSNSIVSGKNSNALSSSVTTMLPNRRQSMNDKMIERNSKTEIVSKTRLDKTMGDCGDIKEITKNESSNSNKSSTETLTNLNYDPFEKAHLQLMELIADDITIPSYSNTTSSRSTPTTEFLPFFSASSSTPKKSVKIIDNKSGEKRASVIDPPYSFQDNRTSRDLDQEFELLESLMNNNLDEASDNSRHSRSIDRVALLHRKELSDDVDVIDPSLINEQDNLHIPEHLPSDDHSPNCNEAYSRIEYAKRNSRESRISNRPSRSSIKPTVRSLPLIKPGQVRPAPDGSSAESQIREGRHDFSRLYQTSKSKSNTRIDFSPESRKNKNNRRLETSSLSVQTSMEIRKTSAEGLEEKEECFNLTRMPTAEELYPDNPTMYEEFRKYEEMYRREKESRSSSSKKQKKKTTDFGINIEEDSKAYGDSAYGSLNRKQQIKDPEGSDQAGEFGSKVQSSSTNSGERLPKYCHECGNKYPVATAKFCVECGVKRLVL